jgi:GTPase SAR1 family protein
MVKFEAAFDHFPACFTATIVILCHSVDSPSSLDNIRLLWIPEILQHQPSTPFLIADLKSDLRGSNSEILSVNEEKACTVSPQSLSAMAEATEALGVLECCSTTKAGMDEILTRIFVEAHRLAEEN